MTVDTAMIKANQNEATNKQPWGIDQLEKWDERTEPGKSSSNTCSTNWVGFDRSPDFKLSPDHFRLVDGRLIENSPAECPNGDLLGADRTLVGGHACISCPAMHHRTWYCRQCTAIWIWPPCSKEPQTPAWPGLSEADADPPRTSA